MSVSVAEAMVAESEAVTESEVVTEGVVVVGAVVCSVVVWGPVVGLVGGVSEAGSFWEGVGVGGATVGLVKGGVGFGVSGVEAVGMIVGLGGSGDAAVGLVGMLVSLLVMGGSGLSGEVGGVKAGEENGFGLFEDGS